MNRKQSSTATASSRHLRDSLTILSSNFPHDERIHHNSNHTIKPRQKQQQQDESQPQEEDGIRLRQEQQQQQQQKEEEETQQQEQVPQSQRGEILLLQKNKHLRELIPVLVSGPLVGSGGGTKRRHADFDEQGWMEIKKRPCIVVKENENVRQDTERAGGTGGENQDHHHHHKEEEEKDGVNNHLQQQWYKDKLQALKSDNERILQKRKDIFQGYARLISSYDYGLKYISNLKDLAQAPDNFMEGNFVDASKGKM